MLEPNSSCPRPEYETIFTSLIGGLIVEGRVPPGDILDAGAYKGAWACFYARQDRRRSVLAVDPDKYLVDAMKSEPYHSQHPNVMPIHGAISDQARPSFQRVHASRSSMKLYPLSAPDRAWYKGDFDFPTKTIDELFHRRSLGLAGLDLEGAELAALQGGNETIARDQPVLATEMCVHCDARATKHLLRYVDNLGYDSFMVEEIVGLRADLRNLLHLPRSRSADFEGSHVLDLAVASKVLLPLTHKEISRFAFPCCARDSECCPCLTLPRRRSRSRSAAGQRCPHCCSHWRVHAYLNKQLASAGEDTRRFTRTMWYDEWWQRWHPHARAPSRWLRSALLARNSSARGFDPNHMRG